MESLLATILGLFTGVYFVRLVVFIARKSSARKHEGFDLHAYLNDKDQIDKTK